VPAPAGTHRIRFEYRPLSVAIGAVASAIGWLAIGLLALAARRRRRVGSSSPVTCDAVAQC
jgi:MYXO-CTERM domain-containing protein